MSVSLHSNDSYNQALSELTRLSNELGTTPVDKMLLRCDKRGHLSFEEKTIWGSIRRFFTVTIFGSKEYDFETNIQKIGKLIGIVTPLLNKNPVIKTLEVKIDQLIKHVVIQKGQRSVSKAEPSPINTKIAALQRMAHTSQSLKKDSFDKVGQLQKKYDALTFAEKRTNVLALCDEMLSLVYDPKSAIKQKDYASRITWLADQCASFFELETAFALYGKSFAASADQSTKDKFVEVGLLLKHYSVVTDLAGERERVDRIQSFGQGPRDNKGFTRGEWEMLQLFSLLYEENPPKGQKRGVERLEDRAVEIRDFLVYATGNTAFNSSLRAQLETEGIDDPNIMSAIDYLATFSFKSDPSKWKSNQVYCEHVVHVQRLRELEEELTQKRALLEKLQNTPLDTTIFAAKDGDQGLRAQAAYKVVEQVKGKSKGFTRKKGHKTTKKFPAVKAKKAADWKKEQIQQTKLATKNTILALNQAIPELEKQVAHLKAELADLKKHFPKTTGINPEKLQMTELPVLDSIYRFNDQLTDDMVAAFELELNPIFKAQKAHVSAVKDAYEWIQERCHGKSGYQTGDLSFVNELKKAKVTGKPASDFVDRAAVALFPYGHMAIIDEEHGAIAFSHQRLAFNHEPISLAEYLYYDTYRIDIAKLVTDKGYKAYEKLLAEDEIDINDLMLAKNMTKDELLRSMLEEKFSQMVADELEQVHASSKEETEKKWQGVARPQIEADWTLDKLKKWCEKANAKRPENMKFELYELFEIPEECDEAVAQKIQELRVEYLRELYKGITNNEETQKRAFLKSWLFAGPLNIVSRLSDKTIDPEKVRMQGEMCCSQFALLITANALKRLQDELGVEGSVNIPKITEKRYAASTTEFVVKEFKDILRPIYAPSILSELIDLPGRDFLKPIPIDSTITYMAKRLVRAY